jgi:ceramide glucosyltransferase
VRPCAGAEPGLDRALASLVSARLAGRVICRFAVAGASDPAAVPAAKAASTLRDAGIDATIVFTSADAPNHKAAQIDAALAQESEPFDVLVVADSDVDLTAFDLSALLSPMMADASVGAVWAPPVETGPVTGTGDRASRALLSASLHAFTILGALDGSALVGKLFAPPAASPR